MTGVRNKQHRSKGKTRAGYRLYRILSKIASYESH
jgi:hypothetical protein